MGPGVLRCAEVGTWTLRVTAEQNSASVGSSWHAPHVRGSPEHGVGALGARVRGLGAVVGVAPAGSTAHRRLGERASGEPQRRESRMGEGPQ